MPRLLTLGTLLRLFMGCWEQSAWQPGNPTVPMPCATPLNPYRKRKHQT